MLHLLAMGLSCSVARRKTCFVTLKLLQDFAKQSTGLQRGPDDILISMNSFEEGWHKFSARLVLLRVHVGS